ncbi:hypothetical protein C8J57DRAFT_1340323 [Mycena rebaudengoi]|nr:hypothetical protein C8J57DRAFT_1340323 [Mycena rebaudengoi]
MHRLPQELIDAILAHLRDDYASLSACSLASTSFVAPAQRGIFRSLWLHAAGSLQHPKFQAIAAALAQSPHLGSYIRDLTIGLGDSDVEFEHSALQLILCAVQNVERLMISSRRPMNWRRLPKGTRSALRAVVMLPAFRSLYLCCMIQIPSDVIFRAASSVSFLSIHHVSLDKEQEIEFALQDVPNGNTQLTHLMLQSTGEHMMNVCNLFLEAPAHIFCIERLTMRMDSASRTYASRLLTAVAPSLRDLSILADGLNSPIDFPHMPLVRTLEIETSVGNRRWLSVQYRRTFVKIATAFPDIEVLTLTFRFKPEHAEIPWRPENTFPEMGASFSTRTKLVHLQRVHFKLIPSGGRSDEEDAIRHLRDAVEQWMPGVPSRMVTFSLSEFPVLSPRAEFYEPIHNVPCHAGGPCGLM